MRSVDGEAREPAVVWLVEPVGEAHQGDLRGRVRHQAVAAGLVPRELLPVDEQRVQPRLRGVVGRRGATGPRSHDNEIIPLCHRPPSPNSPNCARIIRRLPRGGNLVDRNRPARYTVGDARPSRPRDSPSRYSNQGGASSSPTSSTKCASSPRNPRDHTTCRCPNTICRTLSKATVFRQGMTHEPRRAVGPWSHPRPRAGPPRVHNTEAVDLPEASKSLRLS